jgi:hypothetical protein
MLILPRPTELFELCLRMRKEIYENPYVGDPMTHEEDDSFHHDNFSWGNARVRTKGYWTKEIEKKWTAILDSIRLDLQVAITVQRIVTMRFPTRDAQHIF